MLADNFTSTVADIRHRHRKVVRMTALIVTGDVEACLRAVILTTFPCLCHCCIVVYRRKRHEMETLRITAGSLELWYLLWTTCWTLQPCWTNSRLALDWRRRDTSVCNNALQIMRVINSLDHIIVKALRRRQNGRHFTDDIFKCILSNKNVWFSIEISPKIVPGVSN